MKVTHAATVKNEDVIYDNLAGYYDDLSFFNNQKVIVTIKSVSDITWHQHKGYRGVILPQVLDAIEQAGKVTFPDEYPQRLKLEMVHDLLINKFFEPTFSKDTPFGKLEKKTSMSDFNKEQTSQYWESIAKWYAETFHKALTLPSPQEP